MYVQDSDRVIPLLFDYKQAAWMLGLTEQALRDLVWKNRGSVVTAIGRRRMFALSDLRDFIEMHRKPPMPAVNRTCKPRGGRRIKFKGMDR